MKIKYYSIYDDVAKDCGNLFDAKNDGIATRKFMQMAKNEQLDEGLISHLHIYFIGEFDNETKQFIPNTDMYEVVLTDDSDSEGI